MFTKKEIGNLPKRRKGVKRKGVKKGSVNGIVISPKRGQLTYRVGCDVIVRRVVADSISKLVIDKGNEQVSNLQLLQHVGFAPIGSR